MKEKQMISTLVSIYFGSFQLGHIIKNNCMKFYTAGHGIFSISIFYERVWD